MQKSKESANYFSPRNIAQLPSKRNRAQVIYYDPYRLGYPESIVEKKLPISYQGTLKVRNSEFRVSQKCSVQ